MVSSHVSKWKNIFGEQDKSGSFDSLVPRTTNNSEGNLLDVSSEFLAVNWFTTGGGAVSIFETRKFMRVKNVCPLIRGHTGIVTDIKFSPFNPGLLATSSEDGTVKLWNIPEGGLTDDIRDETQVYGGHQRKALLINWSPTVKEVIATMGNDADIHVWDITNAESLYKIKTDDSSAFSVDWNSNGSLLGALLKNKQIHIYDVRASASILSTEAHQSPKIQKMNFADGPYVFSSGFNDKGYREVKLYDTRNFTSSVQSQKIDTLQGMLSNFYDEDTGLVYLYAKGESIVTFLEIREGSIKTGNTYSSGEQASGLAFFPKRTMDYNQSELARAAKLTKDSVHYVSFKYPRRNQGFNEEFYPECYAGEPSMSLNEWKDGASKEPIRKKITEIENKFKSEPVVFEKKVIEEKKTLSNEELINENNALKQKIAKLEEQIAQLEAKLAN
jgi:hypothetical protein